MNIRAICFDMDGTLYPYYWMYITSIRLFLSYPSFSYHFSCVRREIRTMRGIKDFRKKQAELLAQKMNISGSRAYTLIEERIYREWIDSFHIIRPFPHLKQVLKQIKQYRITLALLSDYPVERKLAYLGLEHLWDLKFSSEEVHSLKPNPECFLELIRLLDISPEKILYVGDTYDYDIIGAKQVGMKTAHLSKRQKKGSISDFTFSHYKDFSSIIMEKII
jgi:putative hydrolase of the HAD superfamily